MRYQVIALEDEAYGMVSVCIPVPAAVQLCGGAVYNKVAAVVAVKSADNIKQGGLAAAAGAEDRHKFTFSEGKAYAVKGGCDRVPRFV